MIRQVHEFFSTFLRSRNGLDSVGGDRPALRQSRTRGKRTIADQTDDLGIPTKPVRPAARPAEPPNVANLARPSMRAAPTLPPTPDLPPIGTQPVHAALSPRQRTEQPTGQDNVIEPRTLIVGQAISLSGETNPF